MGYWAERAGTRPRSTNRLINQATRDRLGGLHSADCLLRSVDFAEIEQLQRTGAWEQAGDRLAREAAALQAAGAELLMLCTDTLCSSGSEPPARSWADGEDRPRRHATTDHSAASCTKT